MEKKNFNKAIVNKRNDFNLIRIVCLDQIDAEKVSTPLKMLSYLSWFWLEFGFCQNYQTKYFSSALSFD